MEDGINTKIFLFGWTCISLYFISSTAAFSHGASLSACSDMRPKHIRAHPQNPKKTYITIYTNRSFYVPGDRVPVTVRSSKDFMGFLLQARRVSNDQVAGSFVFIPPGTKLLRCFEDGDTVTHSDKSLKRNLSFVWKSPDQPVGDIKFFLSVVQSYFVYWARLESTIVSGQTQNSTLVSTSANVYTPTYSTALPENPKPKKTHLVTSPTYGIITARPVANTINSSFASPVGTDPTRTSVVHGVVTKTTDTIPTEPVTLSFSNGTSGLGTTKPSLQSHVTHRASLQTLLSQTAVSIFSFSNRLQSTIKTTTSHPCPLCRADTKAGFTSSPPGPTFPPDSQILNTNAVQTTEEIFHYPERSNLKEAQSRKFLHSTSVDKGQMVTKKILPIFLYRPEDATFVKNTVIANGVTSSWVTKSINEFVVPGKGRENQNRGMHLAMTQLGILLGCSAVLGMVLAAGLRCIHAQYCHKRTEVSFSEPDNNVMTMRDNREMMHFKKVRENSFVLVQAEYNWIAPSNNGTAQ